jgi:transposase
MAQRLRVSRPTVAESVRRTQAAGLSWPLPEALDERALESQLLATATPPPGAKRPTPDWATGQRERKRPGVTLGLWGPDYQAMPP